MRTDQLAAGMGPLSEPGKRKWAAGQRVQWMIATAARTAFNKRQVPTDIRPAEGKMWTVIFWLGFATSKKARFSASRYHGSGDAHWLAQPLFFKCFDA